MAEQSSANRLPDNVPGMYYTTEDCDGCAYCASVAPDNFDYLKMTNQYFVCRQPTSPAEEELLREAFDDCPLDAIRADKNCLHVTVGESR